MFGKKQVEFQDKWVLSVEYGLPCLVAVLLPDSFSQLAEVFLIIESQNPTCISDPTTTF